MEPSGSTEGKARELLKRVEEGDSLQDWASGYWDRGERVLKALDGLLQSTVQKADSHPELNHAEVLLRLRRHRQRTQYGVCLVLHSSEVNQELITELAGDVHDVDTILRMTTEPSYAWQLAYVGSYLLEKAGIYCILLRGDNTPRHRGFLDIAFGDSSDKGQWFLAFACLAEMVDAVILYGGFGPYLQHELKWLRTAGLLPRLLAQVGNKIGNVVDQQAWWIVDIAEAVRDASNRTIGAAWDEWSENSTEAG